MQNTVQLSTECKGELTQIDEQSFYKISHVDAMAPFFISVVSDSNHWLFAASTGGLTMGRISPEYAVFPYVTVDKIYESAPHTGPKTIVKVTTSDAQIKFWEPFNTEHNDRYAITRNIYKSELGNVLRFEEINHDLELQFHYTWKFSDEFGFSRCCSLFNQSDKQQNIEFIDGLQNILPAGTPRFTQTQSSNLVDAYKWTERVPETSLALYTLYSAITDRAEPAESLRATTVFSTGLANSSVFLSNRCMSAFKQGHSLQATDYSRGVRGDYLLHNACSLPANQSVNWRITVNVEQTQAQVSELINQLSTDVPLDQILDASYSQGNDALARIMAAADGFQLTGEPVVALHHYANTLFNVLRGGIFADQYTITRADLIKTVKHFNKPCYARVKNALEKLPAEFSLDMLKKWVAEIDDPQLSRLVSEYLPITFGRRHGDPSRPWNQFAIELKDEHGDPLLSYQGNWRDIFQNWEALSLSYPEFTESVIAKFVNASTVDGYNPYRITKQGIDWEVEEPDDPWSYIGYWGDHQIIYLQKLLETSHKFHPSTLLSLLQKRHFSYANVPYRIKGFDDLVDNPKATVLYDEELAHLIEQRVATMGADGKLVLNQRGEVYQVNLMEKLLVPLLTKLSNLVVDGGIWLNTQRPEWNDANNALVGQGLSMVTLYYMNRYIAFLQATLEACTEGEFSITAEVAQWLSQTSIILHEAAESLNQDTVSSDYQFAILSKLGRAAETYRTAMYSHTGEFAQTSIDTQSMLAMLAQAKRLIQHSIAANEKPSGLYHAYNILTIDKQSLQVDYLYDMLEGQVAALSSGALSAEQAKCTLDNLFASEMYRDDQKTFMLYPDRAQQTFLQKNVVPAERVQSNPLLVAMLANNDRRLVEQDQKGQYRFNSALANANVIKDKWAAIQADYPAAAEQSALADVLATYETVFKHSEFTGRSGGMFGFEGLGCIYWHMVSKLLLAVQEVAVESYRHSPNADVTQALIAHYYRVREGIGFNKSPTEYGAFPADPYSHTPKHAGAQQPGMTGQVKEELLTRLVELGGFVEDGCIHFSPFMLREQEFINQSQAFRYLDVDNAWQTIQLAPQSLAYTWCQVPIVYELSDEEEPCIEITCNDAPTLTLTKPHLDSTLSEAIFKRNGYVRGILLRLPKTYLLAL
ncbi:hypothetical protein [Alteromonas flava]|uniref:hypothetical protein n=1 Tax=Alteromonas flava TaxID=2048003 RepID=UPI000C2954C9|nr:hypothetical protein [Alteromonas flava]